MVGVWGGAWPPTQAPQANVLLTSLENVTFICENGRKRAAGRGFLDEMREKSIKIMICAAGEVKFEDLARLRQPSFPGLPSSQANYSIIEFEGRNKPVSNRVYNDLK